MPLKLSSAQRKILEKARKNTIESQIQRKLKQAQIHPNSKKLLLEIIRTIDLMRKDGKSESEIREHLKDITARYEVLREILEDRQEKWQR